MRVYGVILAAMVMGCSVLGAHAQTAETVGKLVARQPITVMSEGLKVSVQPGQDYIVFSGDQIQSGAGQQSSVLEIPRVGSVQVGENTVLTVERSGDAFNLLVAEGEVRFELLPDADVFLVSSEDAAGLAGGAGQGGVSVAAGGRGGYLVVADGSGNVAVSSLATGEVVYQGQGAAIFRLASDRVGAAVVASGQSAFGSVSGGSSAALGGAGAVAAGGGVIAAPLIPAALAAAVGTAAVVDANSDNNPPETVGVAADDAGPASPVTPTP